MNRKEIKAARTRIAEINTRMGEIADALEAEKRGMTNDEKSEKLALVQEKEILQLRMDRELGGYQPSEQEVTNERAFSEAVAAAYNKRSVPEEYRSFMDGNAINVPVTRAAAIQDSTTVTPLIPLTIGEIIEPLEKGLILSKVGCKMQYGLVGDWALPVVAGIEATIMDENAEVADSTIDITKLSPTPKRVTLAIPVSNRAIDQSNNALLEIVRTQMTLGLTRLLNKWMFSPTRIVAKASDGCFVAACVDPAVVTAAGASFTWKDVIKLKGSVMKTGVVFDGTAAYVCSATTYADLEATPRDAGSGRMILENGQINGFPVFMTEYVGEDVLGFGVFNYELVGQFGQMRIIVDPYTGAKKNLVYFVLNTDFDMLATRTEAFGVAKKTPETKAARAAKTTESAKATE